LLCEALQALYSKEAGDSIFDRYLSVPMQPLAAKERQFFPTRCESRRAPVWLNVRGCAKKGCVEA
jgi:hypothetical protein